MVCFINMNIINSVCLTYKFKIMFPQLQNKSMPADERAKESRHRKKA